MQSKLWLAGGTADLSHPSSRGLAGRALRYGDGVFVTLAFEDGLLLDAGAQLERLAAACARIGLRVPPAVTSTAALVDVLRTLELTADANAAVRVQVSAGPSGRGYGRAAGSESWELVEIASPPAARTCRVATASAEARLPVPALPELKSSSALPHILAAREAARLGVDELLRTVDAKLTEGVAANVFWVEGAVLRTPASTLPLYPGVTRAVVLETAAAIGWDIDEAEHESAAIGDAEAVFLTNATRGIEPVTELDGRRLAWPESMAGLTEAVREARRRGGVAL